MASDVEANGCPSSPERGVPSVLIGQDGRGLRLCSMLSTVTTQQAAAGCAATPGAPGSSKNNPTKKRVVESIRQRLASADTNRDGVLDKDEVVAVFEDLLEEEISKKQWRRATVLSLVAGFVLVVLLVGAVVGLTAVVIVKTKDTEVSDNVFVSKSTRQVLGTSASTYAAFSYDAPTAALSSMKQFVLSVNGNELSLQVFGVLRRQAIYDAATGNQTSPPALHLITPVGTLVLEQGFETNIRGLVGALRALGIAMPYAEPLVPSAPAGSGRRRLQPCSGTEPAPECYHLEHDVTKHPDRLQVHRRLVAYDSTARRMLVVSSGTFTFSGIYDNVHLGIPSNNGQSGNGQSGTRLMDPDLVNSITHGNTNSNNGGTSGGGTLVEESVTPGESVGELEVESSGDNTTPGFLDENGDGLPDEPTSRPRDGDDDPDNDLNYPDGDFTVVIDGDNVKGPSVPGGTVVIVHRKVESGVIEAGVNDNGGDGGDKGTHDEGGSSGGGDSSGSTTKKKINSDDSVDNTGWNNGLAGGQDVTKKEPEAKLARNAQVHGGKKP